MTAILRSLFFLSATFIFLSGSAQAPGTDLALNHNRLLREKTGDGVYKQIGNFKVVGTPYLFGEKNKGNLFSPDGTKAYNIFLSYNTYNQDIEFYSSSNPDKPLVKEPGEADSFFIQPNIEIGILSPLKFVYGTAIGSSEKGFYQEVFAGKRFGIYKKYKSELGYVSTNYIQSELRQFDLVFDYYYSDAEKKTVKKIKANNSNVIKEFKSIKDLSGLVSNDAFSASPDEAFKKIFENLNN
ncbi:MAG TPA: hypothetical protein VGO58_10225 [Chitinophagaceae bacterium]|jgi:hypothetical protein|nr:hypothetical protein [Chitinophagaceae bacterium]